MTDSIADNDNFAATEPHLAETVTTPSLDSDMIDSTTKEGNVVNSEQSTEQSSSESPTLESRKRQLSSAENERPSKMTREEHLCIKCLVPVPTAGGIIGTGGEEIKKLKENTGITITVSRNGQTYPGFNRERVIYLSGSATKVYDTILFIHEKIRNDKMVEQWKADRLLGPRNTHMKLVVANTSASKIIGKGGEVIVDITKRLGTIIRITRKQDVIVHAERVVNICGEKEKVNESIIEIIECILKDEKQQLDPSVDYGDYQGYEDYGFDNGRGYGPRDEYYGPEPSNRFGRRGSGPPRRNFSPPRGSYGPPQRSYGPVRGAFYHRFRGGRSRGRGY